MDARVAVVQGENVLNVIVVDKPGQEAEFRELGLIPADAMLVPTLTAGPGWRYVDGKFVPPPETDQSLPDEEEPS